MAANRTVATAGVRRVRCKETVLIEGTAVHRPKATPCLTAASIANGNGMVKITISVFWRLAIGIPAAVR
jgi:hypothetical protein